MSKKIIEKEETSISIIEQLQPEIESIGNIKIVDEQSLTKATEVLSQANKYAKQLEEDKQKITKPINDALKEIRARYKPLENKLEDIILTIRKSMTSYQTEQMRLKKIEEEKIANRVAKGTLKVETGIRKLEELPQTADKIATQSGKIAFKTVKKFEVIDLTQVPIKYHLADETAIRDAMKAGIELPGVKYFEEQVPINNLR